MKFVFVIYSGIHASFWKPTPHPLEITHWLVQPDFVSKNFLNTRCSKFSTRRSFLLVDSTGESSDFPLHFGVMFWLAKKRNLEFRLKIHSYKIASSSESYAAKLQWKFVSLIIHYVYRLMLLLGSILIRRGWLMLSSYVNKSFRTVPWCPLNEFFRSRFVGTTTEDDQPICSSVYTTQVDQQKILAMLRLESSSDAWLCIREKILHHSLCFIKVATNNVLVQFLQEMHFWFAPFHLYLTLITKSAIRHKQSFVETFREQHLVFLALYLCGLYGLKILKVL